MVIVEVVYSKSTQLHLFTLHEYIYYNKCAFVVNTFFHWGKYTFVIFLLLGGGDIYKKWCQMKAYVPFPISHL